MVRTLLFWMLLLFNFFYCIAGKPELKFSNINAEKGLSSNVIYSIYKDSKGYMWFGSEDGLNMFDGYESRIFIDVSSEKTSLSGNIIFHIREDKKGNLWVTTNSGVNILNRDLMTFTHIPLISTDGSVRYRDYCQWLYTDRNNTLYLTVDDETYTFDTLKQAFLELNIEHEVYKSFRKEYKEVAFIDSKDRLWMASRSFDLRIFCYDLTNKKLIANPYGPSFLGINDKIYTIAEHANGDIWLCSNNGIYVVKPDLSGYCKIPLNKGIINAIIFEGKDQAWIAHDTDGLFLYKISEKKTEKYVHREFDPWSISNNKVLSVFKDDNGILWAGTTQGGVNYAQVAAGNTFINLFNDPQNKNSLAYNAVSAILQDKDGDVWIGTDGGGLDCYNFITGKFKHYKYDPGNPNSISGNSILAISQDPEGKIWVGGYLSGINIIDKKTGRISSIRYDPGNPEGLSHNDVRDFLFDEGGIVWIATNGGGLNKYNLKTKKFTVYKEGDNNNIVSNWCLKIFEDKQSYLWIATYGGLSIFDKVKNTFENYRETGNSGSLSNEWIYSIAEDKNGNMWVGTAKGLNSYSRTTKKFTTILSSDGLPNETINGILIDKKNNLWLSTNKGITKFDQKKIEFRNYDVKDGLPGNQFFRGSFFKSNSGQFFFGGFNGLTYFYPDSIQENNSLPPVYITGLLIFYSEVIPGQPNSALSKTMSETKKIVLSYNQSVITFRFAALNYINPEKVQYSYQLSGFDERWNLVGKRREVTFTNLNPGTYTFKVRSTNNDGLWNDEFASVKVIIKPPFWKTWLFRVLTVLIIIGCSIAYFLYRVRAIQRKNHELEKVVKERTKEILDKNEILQKQTSELHEINVLLEERQEEIIVQNDELEKHRNNLEVLVKVRTTELEKAMNKAQESDRLKSAFLANMSHEIRTPMNAVVGFSSLLDSNDITKIEQAELIKLIQTNSDSLLRLIDDILDFSLIETNQLLIRNEPFSLNEVIEQLISYYNLSNQNPKLDIKQNNTFKDQNLVLNSDKHRLQQVISNLMNNAIKFTESGYVELGITKEGDNLCIYVKDTGMGISNEDSKHLFERFRKFNEKSTMARGVGLGLAISKKVADLLGGTLTIESNLGEGSVFKFSIPYNSIITREKIHSVETEKPKPHHWEDKCILVVEDEEANFIYLKRTLERTRAKIVWAENGVEALKQIETDQVFDLILMDIKMPKMDGFEATRRIKLLRPDQIIIAQTAYARPEDKDKFKQTGFDDSISKPVKPIDLLSLLEKYL